MGSQFKTTTLGEITCALREIFVACRIAGKRSVLTFATGVKCGPSRAPNDHLWLMTIRWQRRIRGNIHMTQWSAKKPRNNGSRARAPTRMTTDPCPTPGHSGHPFVNTQGRTAATPFDS
ncbi:hypothetical protein MTP99_011746 [Tenebrio molitor]|nr:hypothetical protein MTP99_011746 [Tenebrio molitor]